MSRKKTHEEYVAELEEKNPNVEVVEEYINSKTPIMHKCLIHNVLWETAPSRVLHGAGCEECRVERFRQVRCKTHEQYVNEVAVVNPDIIVIGAYIDARTPIEHYCKKHNITWATYPDSILRGVGCKECGNEKIREKKIKPHDRYLEDLNAINPNIEVLEEYQGANVAIWHRCKVDGYEWKARPGNTLFGKGCPKCAGILQLTNAEYTERLKLINPHIAPIEEYINSSTPISHMCLIDGHVWKTAPYSALQGYGCPKCAGNAKKTHEEYVKELSECNPNIEVIDEYKGANTLILHHCIIHDVFWLTTPSRALQGVGCPKCTGSRGEKQVYQWLYEHHVEHIPQKTFDDCKDKRLLPFDFYLPDYNICIEYDGEQHFRPVEHFGGEEGFKKRQLHDKIKNQYCKDNNIPLLRIPYFKNVEEELNKFFIHLI